MATIVTTTESVDHIQYRTTVATDSVALLLQQFQGSENIVKFTTVVGAMKQILDTAVIQVAKLRLISSGAGVALDEIGEELGVPRSGLDDDSYRVVLRIRGFKTQSQGTRPDIIDLISRITGTDINTIRTYVGKQKAVDIAFYSGCLDTNSSATAVEDILPLVTSYRLVSLAGTPIGFKSVYDEVDPTTIEGFGSVFDTNVQWGSGGGHLGGLLDATA